MFQGILMLAGNLRKTSVPDGRSYSRALALLARFNAAIVLMHALIIGPLLVQCIPFEGRSLVEFIGYDPCHYPGVAYRELAGTTTVLLAGDIEDSCVDLMMDNPGVAQAGIMLLSTAGEHANHLDADGRGTVLPGPLTFVAHALPRGPGLCLPGCIIPQLALRI
jgi:hypothetical protein